MQSVLGNSYKMHSFLQEKNKLIIFDNYDILNKSLIILYLFIWYLDPSSFKSYILE